MVAAWVWQPGARRPRAARYAHAMSVSPSSRPQAAAASVAAARAADASAPAAQAEVRVDRALTELRHDRLLLLCAQPGDTTSRVLLAAAAETLSARTLDALRDEAQRAGVELRLLLTGERMQALHRAAGEGGAAPGAADAGSAHTFGFDEPPSVEAVQRLTAVTSGAADADVLRGARPATAAMQAAVWLAKRARLTPALVVAELPGAARAALEEAGVVALPAADVSDPSPYEAVRLLRVSDAHVPVVGREDCTLVLFREVDASAEHVAILFGEPDRSQPVRVRLHSSCLTGDLLGSLRCDCGDQLRNAADHLAEHGGVLLYLAQEGRGTGLANKLRAYRLQDSGLDTIDADRYLGFRGDERNFGVAVAMLQQLGIGRVSLLTNNPRKIDSLQRGGIEVVERIALIAPANRHNERYLRTKRDRAGHQLDELLSAAASGLA